MINTYACNIPISISKMFIKPTISNGTINKLDWDIKINQIKLVSIFKSVWPDIIFANKRIAKLNNLAVNEIISIKIKKGLNKNGAPLGKKSEKNCNPCVLKPKKQLLKKVKKDKKNVTVKWLVIAKENGIIPIILKSKINKNNVKM